MRDNTLSTKNVKGIVIKSDRAFTKGDIVCGRHYIGTWGDDMIQVTTTYGCTSRVSNTKVRLI